MSCGRRPEEKACRIKLENTPDNGGWLFYVGNTLYRFPMGEVAPAATRYAILGDLCGKGKAKVPAKCEMSADGESWVEVQRTAVAHEVNEFPIPSVLVGSRELWVRYTGFGMYANECHAGYAFLR